MNQSIVPSTTTNTPIYTIVDITPDLAKRWLAQNTHNRNRRERIVNSYATDMRNGNWVEDGQSIKFAQGAVVLIDNPPVVGGVLLDGQHRLSAVVESGVTIRMLVVSNLPNTTQDTMDTGAKRTLSDVLKLRGESHYVPLAALLSRVHMWQEGARKSVRGIRPTHRQLLALLDEHPEVRQSAEVGARIRNVIHMSPSTAALCHWLFMQIDESDTAFFFARLTDGAGLAVGDPIYALRRAITLAAKDKARMPEEYTTALVIKAWNAFRDGRDVQILMYRAGGSQPEAYPEPK